jgi:hypothetical protein
LVDFFFVLAISRNYLAYPDHDTSLLRTIIGDNYVFRAPADVLEIFTDSCVTVVGDIENYPRIILHQNTCCCTQRLQVPYCTADDNIPFLRNGDIYDFSFEELGNGGN